MYRQPAALHLRRRPRRHLPLRTDSYANGHGYCYSYGGGTPLFATLDSAISLDRTSALATPAATHLGFRVVR